jgi:hypothetical protein
MKGIIEECHTSGKSWVATDKDGTVVGFALARGDFHDPPAISLRYIGVSANSRRSGIFATLMNKLKANGVPLTASVLHSNRSDMANRLVKIGFTKVGSDTKQTKFKWSSMPRKPKPKPDDPEHNQSTVTRDAARPGGKAPGSTGYRPLIDPTPNNALGPVAQPRAFS